MDEEPSDFDAFWAATLAATRSFDLDLTITEEQSPYELVDVFDVTFSGFNGHRIRAWLRVPHGIAPTATVLHLRGYGMGRGLPGELVPWPLAGYACLTLDTRGQGASGTPGDTPDPFPGTGPEHAGFLTRGIGAPEEYYYRRVFSDAVRAVETIRLLPDLGDLPVFVFGGSQGGGMAIAVGGLTDVDGVLADVPFLCDFPRAVALATSDPMLEIVRFLATRRGEEAAVFETLSYFDAKHHARRASAPALFAVGLRDVICPPETVYAAFEDYAGPKEIAVYPFNGHEGGEGHHDLRKLRWLKDRLAGR